MTFVFDALKRTARRPYDPSPSDQATGDLMHGYWIKFARYGDPNRAGRPIRPRFYAKDTLIVFTNTGVGPVDDLEGKRLDLIEPSVVKDRPGS